jgi:hypothetical protein
MRPDAVSLAIQIGWQRFSAALAPLDAWRK